MSSRARTIADAFLFSYFSSTRASTRIDVERALARCVRCASGAAFATTDANAIDLDHARGNEDEGQSDAQNNRAYALSLGIDLDAREARKWLSLARGERAPRVSEDASAKSEWSFVSQYGAARDDDLRALYDVIDGFLARERESERERAKVNAEASELELELARERKRRSERRRKRPRGRVPTLCAPRREEVKEFLTRVASALERRGHDWRWPMSFAKARVAVGDVGREGASERDAAATEFVMLHFGGKKYRAKCFEDDEKEEEEDGDGDEAKDLEGEWEKKGMEARDEVAATAAEDKGTLGKRARRESETASPARETGAVDVEEPAASGGGVALLVSDRGGHWEGRMRALGAAAGEDVEGARRCLPWWEDIGDMSAARVGRWGEMLVFNYLLVAYPARDGFIVDWLNMDRETTSFYDIKVTNTNTGRVVYVEVKSTRWEDKNAFEISPWEWDFAVKPGVEYHIYRVFNAGNKEKVRVKVVRNPALLVREKKIGMALII